MHELSLARSILRQVEELRDEYVDQHLSAVELEVGLMSGVDPDILAVSLEDEQVDRDKPVEFVINVVPVLAHCSNCQKDFQVEHYAFSCVLCGSTEIEVTGGDCVRIMSITVEDQEV